MFLNKQGKHTKLKYVSKYTFGFFISDNRRPAISSCTFLTECLSSAGDVVFKSVDGREDGIRIFFSCITRNAASRFFFFFGA